MSKSYSLAFVAVVICLSIILLSSESDAQSTIDETESCGASPLDEVTSIIARDVKEVKNLLASMQERSSSNTLETSKDSLVSALVCKYMVSHSTLSYKQTQ